MSTVLFIFLLLPYFLPFLCACAKNHPAKAAFFVANILFGWTIIGWLILLVMAANSKPNVVPVAIVSYPSDRGSWQPFGELEKRVTPPPVFVAPPVPKKLTGERFSFATQSWEKTYTDEK
jgi:hypothetical protein